MFFFEDLVVLCCFPVINQTTVDHPNGTSWYLLVAPKCQPVVTMFGNQKNEAATWMGMFDSFLWESNDDGYYGSPFFGSHYGFPVSPFSLSFL